MSQKESLFMRLFYAGIGLGAAAIEKLEQSVRSLVQSSKNVTLDDVKEQLNKVVKDLAKRKDTLQKQFDEYVEKLIDKYEFAKKEDIDRIKEKLDELEKLIKEKLNK